jgi:hypothetical protein
MLNRVEVDPPLTAGVGKPISRAGDSDIDESDVRARYSCIYIRWLRRHVRCIDKFELTILNKISSALSAKSRPQCLRNQLKRTVGLRTVSYKSATDRYNVNIKPYTV